MSDVIVPDSVEPIVARRCWGIAQMNSGTLLCSGHKAIWPANEPLVANCSFRKKSHTAPASDCSCGIYGLNEQEPWPYYKFEGKAYAVWGTVFLWGKVITGENGYRAQYAYPKELFLAHKDFRFVGPLRESYKGVPVALRNPFPEVVSGHRH